MARLTPLSGPKNFQKLKLKGKSTRPNSWMVVRWIRNEVGKVRLGCTLPRYIGKAVLRNRIRRWCREYVRHKDGMNELGLDINVILLRKEKDFYKNVSHSEFDRALDQAWGRIRKSGTR